jgi:hypothetical protein
MFEWCGEEDSPSSKNSNLRLGPSRSMAQYFSVLQGQDIDCALFTLNPIAEISKSDLIRQNTIARKVIDFLTLERTFSKEHIYG